jgi:hypothetical protein
MSNRPLVQYACEDCGSDAPCFTCGQHFCVVECGACGGGCRCYCSCPTMREDDGGDFWS